MSNVPEHGGLAQTLRTLDYPCRYPFKCICQPPAVATVRQAIRDRLPPAQDVQFAERASRGGRYIAVTAHVEAQSAEQIEAVYAALAVTDGIVTQL